MDVPKGENLMQSLQFINDSITNLCTIHEELLQISEQKTGYVKEGNLDKLQQMLGQERKIVHVLEIAERKRQAAVEHWCAEQNLSVAEGNITTILTHIADDSTRQELEKRTISLSELILKIKQQEQLNHMLIAQSMQFVQFSLDQLSPSISKLNYGSGKQTETVKRSVFDSKA